MKKLLPITIIAFTHFFMHGSYLAKKPVVKPVAAAPVEVADSDDYDNSVYEAFSQANFDHEFIFTNNYTAAVNVQVVTDLNQTVKPQSAIMYPKQSFTFKGKCFYFVKISTLNKDSEIAFIPGFGIASDSFMIDQNNRICFSGKYEIKQLPSKKGLMLISLLS